MKKSSLKEVVIALNMISALGILFLVDAIQDPGSPIAVMFSIVLCLFGSAAIVLNIVYISSRPTRSLVKTALILISILIFFFVLASIGTLLTAG